MTFTFYSNLEGSVQLGGCIDLDRAFLTAVLLPSYRRCITIFNAYQRLSIVFKAYHLMTHHFTIYDLISYSLFLLPVFSLYIERVSRASFNQQSSYS